MSIARRVVVTGLGAVTPLGVGIQPFWSRLINSECGIRSTINAGLKHNEVYKTIPSQVAGIVPRGNGDHEWNAPKLLQTGDERLMAPFSQYAVVAANEACRDAGWNGSDATEEQRERAGVCLGSGIGTFDDIYDTSIAFHQSGYKKIPPLFVPRLLINMAAGHISLKHHLKGPNHAVSTACTTGLHSLGDAYRFILHNDADIMIAGSAESSIHPLSIGGFARAKSLSTKYNDQPEKSSRPFDRDRCGFVIGEGAGVVVLEDLEHARRRGVGKVYAEIVGYGLSSDSHHITAPPPDGNGAYRAMRNCLRSAGLQPGVVDYVNAHATATVLGDVAENRAIKRLLLGEEGKKRPEDVNISSIKGAIGHLLGAAGAVESIATVLSVFHDTLLPTLNLENVDREEFDCNYVPLSAQEKKVNVALTNSFGFGGTNSSLCFKKFEDSI